MCRCNSFNIFPIELVSSVHSGLVPIGPVNPIFEGRDGEGVSQDIG